jgi:hypothetical protein
MKNIVSVLIIFIFCFSTANAQKKQMEKLKAQAQHVTQKKLAVVLKKETNDKNKAYNDYIKKAIVSEWTINVDIEYVDFKTYKSLKKENSKDYAYIVHLTKINQDNINDTYSFVEGIIVGCFEDKYAVFSESFEFTNSTTLGDMFKKIQKANNFISTMANYEYKKMSMKDIKAAYGQQTEKAKILKTQTLYIDKDNIEKKLEDKISSIYKYEYKLVSKEEIDNAVTNNDESISYIYNGIVFNADTGDMVLQFIQPKGKVMVSTPIDMFKTSKLKLKEFKDLISYLK